MPFEQMDVRSMNYDDGAFDAVVDKGTFDSILCGDGSGPNADQMLSEIHRVLSPSGFYICIIGHFLAQAWDTRCLSHEQFS